MTTYRNIFVFSFFSIALLACGGGGGGSSSGPAPVSPPPPPPVDTTSPTIISVSPSNNAVDIELDDVISIQFSEAIDATSVSAEDFTLSQNNVEVTGTFSFDSDTNTISFTPLAPFQHLLIYQLDLDKDITDLAGNSLLTNMTSTFTTRDIRWSTPLTLNSNSSSVDAPSIVLQPNNDLIAYWTESMSSTKNIWTARYQDGLGWGTPAAVFEDVNEQSSSVQIAAFSENTIWGLWESRNLETDALSVKRASLDTTSPEWSGPLTVDNGSAGPPRHTRFRTSGNETGMIFIIRNDGINDSLYARHVSGFVPSSTETLLEQINFGFTHHVVAGMDDFGNALAVWAQWNGTKGAAYANRYSASSGQWDSGPSRIDVGGSSQVFNGAKNMKLAMTGNGNAMAVWLEENTTTAIYANNYVLGSGWQGPEILASGSLNSTIFPNIAMFPNGDAIAVWDQGNGTGNLQVVYRLFRANVWQPTVVLANDGYSNYGPVVSTGGNNEAVIAWGHVDTSSSNVSVYASRFDGVSSFHTGEKLSVGLDSSNNYLSNGSYGDDENAAIIDSNGRITVIWEEGGSTTRVSRTE